MHSKVQQSLFHRICVLCSFHQRRNSLKLGRSMHHAHVKELPSNLQDTPKNVEVIDLTVSKSGGVIDLTEDSTSSSNDSSCVAIDNLCPMKESYRDHGNASEKVCNDVRSDKSIPCDDVLQSTEKHGHKHLNMLKENSNRKKSPLTIESPYASKDFSSSSSSSHSGKQFVNTQMSLGAGPLAPGSRNSHHRGLALTVSRLSETRGSSPHHKEHPPRVSSPFASDSRSPHHGESPLRVSSPHRAESRKESPKRSVTKNATFPTESDHPHKRNRLHHQSKYSQSAARPSPDRHVDESVNSGPYATPGNNFLST